jgi:hypothetical protein
MPHAMLYFFCIIKQALHRNMPDVENQMTDSINSAETIAKSLTEEDQLELQKRMNCLREFFDR